MPNPTAGRDLTRVIRVDLTVEEADILIAASVTGIGFVIGRPPSLLTLLLLRSPSSMVTYHTVTEKLMKMVDEDSYNKAKELVDSQRGHPNV